MRDRGQECHVRGLATLAGTNAPQALGWGVMDVERRRRHHQDRREGGAELNGELRRLDLADGEGGDEPIGTLHLVEREAVAKPAGDLISEGLDVVDLRAGRPSAHKAREQPA